jgi:hypothetical protein
VTVKSNLSLTRYRGVGSLLQKGYMASWNYAGITHKRPNGSFNSTVKPMIKQPTA